MNDNRDVELGCAQNMDGTLKDANDITWFNDKDDDVPMLPSARPDTPMEVDSPEERPRARTRPQEEARNMFLDLEAQVDEEDSNGEDDNDDEDDFIDDTAIADVNPPKNLRQTVQMNESPFDRFIAELEQTYTTGGPSTASSTVPSAPNNFVRFPTDKGLWEGTVPMGDERKIVISLVSKAFNNEALISQYPKSVFARNSLPGKVFFESDTFTPVRRLCEGVKGIDLRKIVKVMDPFEWERPLAMPYGGYIPKTGTWVRLSKGVHKGDLAYVSGVHPRSLRPLLLFIPRINYTSRKRRDVPVQNPAADANGQKDIEAVASSGDRATGGLDEGGKEGRGLENEERGVRDTENTGAGGEEERGAGNTENTGAGDEEKTAQSTVDKRQRTKQPRPPAVPLDLYRVHENKLRYSFKISRGIKYYRFRRKCYDSLGFCMHVFESTHYYHEEALPTIEELHPFLNCPSMSLEERQDQLRRLECARMTSGTKVKIQDTEYEGEIGVVEGLEDDVAAVRVNSSGQVVRFHVNSLRRHFQSGDTVRIIAGEHQGVQGWITLVLEDIHMAYIFSDRTGLDYAYPLHFLEAKEWDFRHASTPGTTKCLPDLRDKVYSRLVGMEVLIIKGPHKGYWGHVHSTTIFGEANVSLQGKHVHSGRLERVQTSQMLYRNREVDANWHRFNDKRQLVIEKEAKGLINMSLIDTTYPDANECRQLFFPTHSADVLIRVEERNLDLPSSDPWQVDQRDEEMQRRPETMSAGHWLCRLDSLGEKPSRIYLRVSQAAEGCHKYAGENGYFKTLVPPNVTMGFNHLADWDIPFQQVEPCYPDRVLVTILVLQPGDLFGKKMVVCQYPGSRPDTICTVREYPRRGKKGGPLPTHRVPLRFLTVCSET